MDGTAGTRQKQERRLVQILSLFGLLLFLCSLLLTIRAIRLAGHGIRADAVTLLVDAADPRLCVTEFPPEGGTENTDTSV